MECREVSTTEAAKVADEKLQEAGIVIPGTPKDFKVCLVDYKEFRSVARIHLRLAPEDVKAIPRSIGDGRIDPIKLAPYEDDMIEGAILPADSSAYRITTSTYFGAVMFQGGPDSDELLILAYHLPTR